MPADRMVARITARTAPTMTAISSILARRMTIGSANAADPSSSVSRGRFGAAAERKAEAPQR